jgi:hypothetical protein
MGDKRDKRRVNRPKRKANTDGDIASESTHEKRPGNERRTWRLPGGSSLTLCFDKAKPEDEGCSPDELCTAVLLTSAHGCVTVFPLHEEQSNETWHAPMPEALQ